MHVRKGDGLSTYVNLDFASGGDELLELGRGLIKGWFGDIGHEHAGTFFGEEDACFETNTTDHVSQLSRT